MKKIEVNNVSYEIVRGDKDIINEEELSLKMTEYFDCFDYIFGDYAYDKLRLKGYNDSKNKKVNKINDIKYLDDYIKNYCAYGAKYFLLKKIK